MSPGYKVLFKAEPPHICDLPVTEGFYQGTIIECNDCGKSYVLDQDRGTLSWVRRNTAPKPPKMEER